MLLEEGKSYKYIGNTVRFRGKTFQCKLVASEFGGLRYAYFNMGYGTRSFHVDGRGRAYNKICWQDIVKKKFKTTHWK